MCKETENGMENESDTEKANILIVETKEGYEIIIEVNNGDITAKIRDYFEKIEKNNKYTIKYNKNGGTGEEVEEQEIRKGFSIKLRENTYTKTDYKFVGWCEDNNGEGEIYQPGGYYTPTKDTTLYAIWRENVITITFNANAGTGEMENAVIAENTDTVLPVNTFTKIGYTFTKWNTKADGSGEEYENGATININKDITLYAQWEINKYTVTLNHENGTSVSGAGTYDYGTKINIETTGSNNFIGWYNGSTLYSADKNTEVTVTGNINLTAKYTILVSSITLKNGNTTLSSTSNLTGYYTNVTSLNYTTTITATISPSNATNKEVEWTSSNPNIVSVDSTGKLTFKGVSGSTKTCTITCRSKDGNISTSCIATVNQHRVYLAEISINSPYGNWVSFGHNLGSPYIDGNTGKWPAVYGKWSWYRNGNPINNLNQFTEVTYENLIVGSSVTLGTGTMSYPWSGLDSSMSLAKAGITPFENYKNSSTSPVNLGNHTIKISPPVGDVYFSLATYVWEESVSMKYVSFKSIYLSRAI